MSKARELAELGAVYDSGALSNRNLVINGAMQVFQRGTSFTNSSTAYNADRWSVDNNADGGGRSTDAPDGFTYSLKVDPGSGSNAALRHAIELPAAGEGGVFRSGQKFTLSFYVKSENAGEDLKIFAASGTNVNATTTSQVSAQTIGTTTTSWVRHIFTFTSNNVGGSDTCYNIVPFVTTPSGAVYWTGFQLELVTEATDFEHRSFGDEMSRCQRYFTRFGGTNTFDLVALGGMGTSSTVAQVGCIFPTRMRATPSVAMTDLALADSVNSQVTVNSVAISSSVANDQMAWMNFNTSGSLTAHRPYYVRVNSNSTTGGLKFDAEL